MIKRELVSVYCFVQKLITQRCTKITQSSTENNFLSASLGASSVALCETTGFQRCGQKCSSF